MTEDGTITARGPRTLPPGEHRVVIVVEETPTSTPPGRRFGNMAAFRESLDVPTYSGNTVVEMREEERS